MVLVFVFPCHAQCGGVSLKNKRGARFLMGGICVLKNGTRYRFQTFCTTFVERVAGCVEWRIFKINEQKTWNSSLVEWRMVIFNALRYLILKNSAIYFPRNIPKGIHLIVGVLNR